MTDEQPKSNGAERDPGIHPSTIRTRTDTEKTEHATSSRSTTLSDHPVTPESPRLGHRASMTLAFTGDQFSSPLATPTMGRRAVPLQASIATNTSGTSSSVSERGGNIVRHPHPERPQPVNGRGRKRRGSTLDDTERSRYPGVTGEDRWRDSPQPLASSTDSLRSNAYADDGSHAEERNDQVDIDREDDPKDDQEEAGQEDDQAVRDTSTPIG